MSISICMATYNGARYLPEQVTSILAQMGEGDELVVVDDSSTDGTVAYLEGLGDPRIKVHRNERNLGHVQSFGKVIGLADQPFIMMADQDDIWLEGRLSAMREALLKGSALVSANSDFMDGAGAAIPPLHADLLERDSARHGRNILRIFTGKAFYDGCTMAFSRGLRDLVLPIPSYVESHDLWIAMAANAARSNAHLERKTLRRRVHGKNASVVQRPLTRKLWSRAIFLLSLLHIWQRLLTRQPGRRSAR